jgi:lysozyme family protein
MIGAKVMTDIFEKVIKSVLENEGGFSDDPSDRGGRTQYGITQQTYDNWHDEKGAPRDDVAQISLEEAVAIYREKYWEAGNFELINNPKLAGKLLDLAVNCGVGASVLLLQDAVNVCLDNVLIIDGALGPKTAKAANAVPQELLYDMVCFLAAHRYLNIIEAKPDQKKFRRGWLLRLARSNYDAPKVA